MNLYKAVTERREFTATVRHPVTGEAVTVRGVVVPNYEADRAPTLGRMEPLVTIEPDGISVWTHEQDPQDGAYVHAHCAWTTDPDKPWTALYEEVEARVIEAQREWVARFRKRAAVVLTAAAAEIRAAGCDPYNLDPARDAAALVDTAIRWSDDTVGAPCPDYSRGGVLSYWEVAPWSEGVDLMRALISEVEMRA